MTTKCTCTKDGFNDAGVDTYGCPLHSTPTVEEIVEEFDHKTYPPLKGNLLQNRTDEELLEQHDKECNWLRTTLTTYGQSRYDDGVKAERERVREWENTRRKTKKFPQQLIRHDNTVEYFERLSDSDTHYNEALDHLLEFLSDNK